MSFPRWMPRLITCVFFLTFGLFAQANELSDAEIESELNGSSSFTRASNGSYQFQKSDYIDQVGTSFATIEQFHTRLMAGRATALPSQQSANWVPIAGNITIFVPKYQTVYPLNKQVGDGFVQSRLIRAQLYNQLGRNLITTVYGNEAQQAQQLYDNAYAIVNKAGFAKKFGDRLTAQDVTLAGLDFIWPETRVINGESVLVPILYLTESTLTNEGVHGHQVEFIASNANFNNIEIRSGSITSRRNSLLIAAKNFVIGEGASVTSTGDLNLAVGGTLLNYGNISTSQVLNITAGNYAQKTMVYRFRTSHGYNDQLGLVSRINVGDSMEIKTQGDIVVQGSEVSAGSNIVFEAAGDIKIGTLTLASGKELITSKTRYQESTLEHVRSSISAGDNIKLMAGGMIEINAANLHADRGHIELLAGMGVSILDELNQEQSSFHGKWRKLTVDESAYVTVAMRAVLDAGKGIRIRSNVGDITLRATDISSLDGTSLSADGGRVNLLMNTVNDQYNYQSVRERTFTIKSKSRGHDIVTAVPNTIVGGLTVQAVAGLNVEYTGDRNKSLEQQIDELKVMPGMEWISELQQDSSLDVDWALVEEQYKTWNKTSTNLSPAAIAIISIVVACVAGPGAAALGELAGGVAAGAASSAISAAVTAGVTSMAVQTAVITSNAFVNGEYDLYEIQKDINSKETMTTVATSMVTAAALSYLDSAFFEDIDVDALAKEQGVDPSTIDTGLLRDAKGQLNLIGQATQVTSNAAASAFIDVLASGESFSDFGSSFDDQFKAALVQNASDSIGKKMSEKIGVAYKEGDINNLTRYIAHAGAGCFLGVGKGYENSESDEANCLSGAGGAIVGELVSDVYKEEQTTLFLSEERARVEELEALGLSQAEIAEFLMSPEMEAYYGVKFDQMKASGVNLAKLSGAFAALLAGGDVNIAAAAAENASANNAFFLIPLGIMALKAIDVALTAGDLWRIYLMYQSGNVVGASAELAKFAGEGLAGKVIPGFRTAEEMLSYLRKNGVLSEGMVNSIKKIFDGNKTEIDQRNIPSIDYGNKVVKDVPAGSKGSWDKTVNGKLEADTVYRLDNGHVYVTDANGRVTNVGGQVGGIKLDRNSYQQRCVGHGGSGCSTSYDGGHLIATHLGGAGDKINLVPMSRDLNRIDYRAMEIELGKQLDAGKAVSLKIDVAYPNSSSSTPSMIEVTAWIDGVEKVYSFKQ